jgi:putative Holliday junction resolvase
MIVTAAADFREALPGGGRLIGLDVGSKTIGVALCDAQWTFATAAELIRRGKFSKDLERLKVLAAEQHVAGIVVGLPLNLDGSESPRSQSTRAFARNLEQLGRPILLGDSKPDRSRRKPRAPSRAGRQDGRRLHPPGRDRRFDHGLGSL